MMLEYGKEEVVSFIKYLSRGSAIKILDTILKSISRINFCPVNPFAKTDLR